MPVIVNEYFLNYRAIANGIANSGSCFGSILFPPLFEFLVDKYGLPGFFLLTGGIVFHTAISAAVMRPPPWLQKTNRKASVGIDCRTDIENNYVSTKIGPRRTSEYDAVIKGTKRKNSESNCFSKRNELYSIKSNDHCRKSDVLNIHKLEDITEYVSDTIRLEKKEITLPVKKCCLKEPNDDICKSIEDLKESLNTLQEAFSKVYQLSTVDESFKNSNELSAAGLKVEDERNAFAIKECAPVNGVSKYSIQNYENNSFSDGVNEHNLNSFQENDLPKIGNRSTDTDNCSNNLDSSYEKSLSNKMTAEQYNEPKLPQGILNSFKHVLTCPMFYIISITNVSFYTLFFTFVLIIVDFLLDNGIPKESTKYVLFAFGISDLLGRLCLGWITDCKFLRRSHFVMVCIFLIGLTFFSFPFATSYVWMIIISCFYGLLQGCTMVIFPILLVDYLGLQVHSVAMGCLCFLNGIASLIRPFLIGKLLE